MGITRPRPDGGVINKENSNLDPKNGQRERGGGDMQTPQPHSSICLWVQSVVGSHSGLISQLGSSLKMTARIIDLNAKIHSDDVPLGTVRSPSDLVF